MTTKRDMGDVAILPVRPSSSGDGVHTPVVAPAPERSAPRRRESGVEFSALVVEPINWERAYTDNADFVWRNLRRMGLSEEDARDALHEVFLVFHRRRDSFDPSRGSLRSWLFGIAANVVRAERRKKRAIPHPDSQECYEAQSVSRPTLLGEASWRATDGARTLSRGDLRQALRAALAALSPEHRAVFTMFEMEGYDCAFIAAELGIPVGTVYSRLHKARTDLKRTLEQFGCSLGGDS